MASDLLIFLRESIDHSVPRVRLKGASHDLEGPVPPPQRETATASIIAEDADYRRRTPQEQFLENIDDDEAVAIVRRSLIPTDRLQLRAEIGKGIVRSVTI